MSDINRAKVSDVEPVQVIRDYEQSIRNYMKEQRRIFIEEHPDQHEKIIEDLKKSGISLRERKMIEEYVRLLGLKK